MNNLQKIISTDNLTKEKILPHLHPKQLSKGQKLSSIASLYYLSKGMIREYVVDDEGEEKILQWYEDGQFFISIQPAHYFESVQDSTVIHLTIKSFEYLDIRLEIILQVLARYQAAAALWKIKPAKLRFHRFQSLYPKIACNADKQYIANFLNITPSTLSRIDP